MRDCQIEESKRTEFENSLIETDAHDHILEHRATHQENERKNMFYGHKIKTNQTDVQLSTVIQDDSHDSDMEDKIVLNSDLVNKY